MKFMNKYFSTITVAMAVSCLIFFSACDEDPPLPDNVTEFQTDQLGMSSSEEELTININLTREAETEGTITVAMDATGVTYGTDFTTDPPEYVGNITITVPSGATTASFKVIKTNNVLLDGDESIKFTVSATSPTLVIGEKKELTLSFSEIVASSGELLVTGGGTYYPNKVFIDLSANRLTAVSRTTWDLGFSTTDDFRVILNSSNGMMARALSKNDLTQVTAADTVGFGAQLSLSAVFAAINSSTIPGWVSGAVAWIDDPTGDLAKTAMAPVSIIPTDNKVYIINRGSGPGANQPALGWKKVRIVRNGTNYTLQHADINASNFSEVQITKDAAYRFNYVSLGTAPSASVEPAKTKWDIAWTGFTNTTNFGTGPVPYYFQDIVLQNTSGVQVAQVLESSVAYDAFAEGNLTGLALSSSQVAIGSNWRSGGGPGVAPAVRPDRYYIIKDPEGNMYKLKFTALTTGGERGYPQFKYALVKKAS
jgi:hypothetical protein